MSILKPDEISPSNNTEIVVPKLVNSSGNDISSIGINQSWQQAELTDTGAVFLDGTPKYRANNTDYTNTTDKPIMVSIHHTNLCEVVIGGVTLGSNQGASSVTVKLTPFLVPSGATYRANTVTPLIWSELR